MGKRNHKIHVFPGGRIEPEILREALRMIRVISGASGVTFDIGETAG